MQINHCHICQSKTTKINHDCAECINCHHIMRNYIGDNISYHKHQYRKQKSQHRDINEFDANGEVTVKFHESRQSIVNNRIQIMSNILDNCKSLLDIGAGAGTFARSVSRYVKTIECVELSPPLIKEIQRLGYKLYDEDFLKINNLPTFDITCAWHVLEHIENARLFVQKISDITNKFLVIEVPCNRKIRKEYDGHVHHFNKKSLITLLNQCGLTDIELYEGVQSPAILAIIRK